MRTRQCLITFTFLWGFAVYAGDGPMKTWTFENDSAGALPQGFTSSVGEWKIVATDNGKVLAQSAKNANPVFNIALVDGTDARDVDISVKLKAIAGELDQGGGLVWRCQDANNYYVARMNPLESNYRVYKVVAGKRTQLDTKEELKIPAGEWHVLKIRQAGEQAAIEIDRIALAKLAEARSTFLDLDGESEIATPVETGRSIDLQPMKLSVPTASPRRDIDI